MEFLDRGNKKYLKDCNEQIPTELRILRAIRSKIRVYTKILFVARNT